MLGIVTSVANLATTFIDSKAKVKAAEAETKMKLATGEINWEQAAINASKDSFKDELWTGVFVLILAANFIPALQPYYGSRLRELAEMPSVGDLGNVRLNRKFVRFSSDERFQ